MISFCFISECLAGGANLTNESGDLLGGLAVASVGQFADVLKRVVRPGATKLFDLSDHHAEAVIVLDEVVGVGNFAEVLLEERVNELTVIHLSLELSVSFWGAFGHNSLGKIVKLVLTRVNGLDVTIGGENGIRCHLGVFGVLVVNEFAVVIGLGLASTLESTDGFSEEG